MLNHFWAIISLLLLSCVPEVNNPEEIIIELDGASSEEIEEGSFATAEISFENSSNFRNELTFLLLDASESTQGYNITIKIDPKGRKIHSPGLVLPNNFEFISSFNGNFTSLIGNCSEIISSPCEVSLLFTPKNNFQTTSEILFHYTHDGKGYRTRIPVFIKAVSKLNTDPKSNQEIPTEDQDKLPTGEGEYGPISSGAGNNMCGIGHAGEIKCWGSPLESTLGFDGKYSNWGDSVDELGDRIPIFMLDKDVKKLRLVNDFGCIQFIDDSLKCFGKNNDGALARNNSQPISLQSLNNTSPINFPRDLKLIDFDLGEGHVCGHFKNMKSSVKEVRCWGRNDYGQSGIGDFDPTNTPIGYGYYDHLVEKYQDFTNGLFKVPLEFPNDDISSIVSSKNSNCVLTVNQLVKCWGDNLYGQLGLGDQKIRGNNNSSGSLSDPLMVGNENLLVKFGTNRLPINIYGGPGEHFCASLTNDKLKCWGRNDRGQLGQGNTNHKGDNTNELGDNLNDIDLPVGHEIIDVSMGTSHSCVLLKNTTSGEKKVRCFGYGESIGSQQPNNIGDDIGEMGSLEDIDFGQGFTVNRIVSSGQHNCATSEEGEIKCFGMNQFGQLGVGHIDNIGNGPGEMGENLIKIALPEHQEITDIAINEKNTCLVLDKRKVACLGDNSSGYIFSSRGVDLGTDAGNSGAALAALPLGNKRATQITVGFDHACAVFKNSQAKCWGKNDYGQLGLESTKDYIEKNMIETLPYINLGSNTYIKSIHAGKHFTCAVVSDIKFDGPLSDRPTPHPLRLKCWGRSQFGQTGLETESSIGDQPGEMGENLDYVNLGSDSANNPFLIVDFDAGTNHSCAIIRTKPTLGLNSPREIKCWGNNNFGQLGIENDFQIGDNLGEMGNNLAITKVYFQDFEISGTLTRDPNSFYLTWNEIKLGEDFSCARVSTSIYCWGKNDQGQLGVGNTSIIGDNFGEMNEWSMRLIPKVLSTDSNANNIGLANKSQWAVGNKHVCLHNFQRVHCWGAGRYLGTGFGINVGDTQPALSGDSFTQEHSGKTILGISAQGESTCLYYSDGMAKCWGNGKYLGNGRKHDQGNYYRVLGVPNFPFLWF